MLGSDAFKIGSVSSQQAAPVGVSEREVPRNITNRSGFRPVVGGCDASVWIGVRWHRICIEWCRWPEPGCHWALGNVIPAVFFLS